MFCVGVETFLSSSTKAVFLYLYLCIDPGDFSRADFHYNFLFIILPQIVNFGEVRATYLLYLCYLATMGKVSLCVCEKDES